MSRIYSTKLTNVPIKKAVVGLSRSPGCRGSDAPHQRATRRLPGVRDLFGCETTVTLYDLTNTYFEGAAAANPQAARGRSKEKRSDCPLVTLGLVLDGSGFVRRSETFAGHAAEVQTLEAMLIGLDAPRGSLIVMDAGIAAEANLTWLVGARVSLSRCQPQAHAPLRGRPCHHDRDRKPTGGPDPESHKRRWPRSPTALLLHGTPGEGGGHREAILRTARNRSAQIGRGTEYTAGREAPGEASGAHGAAQRKESGRTALRDHPDGGRKRREGVVADLGETTDRGHASHLPRRPMPAHQ